MEKEKPIDMVQLFLDNPDIKLAEVQADLGSSIEEEKGREEIAGMRADRNLRLIMGIALMVLFVLMNGVVVYLVSEAAEMDAQMITSGKIKSSERLISENVYMSLVGATVVQLSSILFAIARYLFPAGKGDQ